MTEYPVFVPFGPEHLAAVVTVPEDDPRALVLLLQGAGGAPHSHRYRLWTRTARALAAQGFASIRMDYRGIGDSTGSYRFAMEEPPVEEAAAIAERGLRWVGVDRLGVVGNCIGARAAVVLGAHMESCASAVCVLPMALGPVLRTARRHPRRRLRALVRAVPGGRAMAQRVRAIGASRPVQFVPEAGEMLRRGALLFLHGGTQPTRAQMRRAVARLSGYGRSSTAGPGVVEVRFLPSEGVMGLRPLRTQEVVIDEVVGWMDATLPGRPPALRRPDTPTAQPGRLDR